MPAFRLRQWAYARPARPADRLLASAPLRITRTELDGRITVLADRCAGKRLNSPNDVVCRSDGTIWFSDPHYGINTDYEGGKQTPELPPVLYRLDPQDGSLQVMADDFEGPNGLAFSPDERRLYVAESGRQFAADPVQHIRVFDVLDDGKQLSPGRIFHKITPGFADGFRLDQDGNVWSSAADGVHCIVPDGTKLGRIKVPFTVSNLAFGGRNRSRLFICASTRCSPSTPTSAAPNARETSHLGLGISDRTGISRHHKRWARLVGRRPTRPVAPLQRLRPPAP